MSAKSIKAKADLRAQGFASHAEKSLSLIKSAISSGAFAADVDNSTSIDIAPIDLSTELGSLTNGSFGVVLVKYNKDSTDPIEPIFACTDNGKIESMLQSFYSTLEMQSKPKVVKPLIIKYKKSELRSIVKAMELFDVNGGDVDNFLDTLHLDKKKFNDLRLIPSK